MYIISSAFKYLESLSEIVSEHSRKGEVFLITFSNCRAVKLEKKNEGNSLYFNRLKGKIDEYLNWCYEDICSNSNVFLTF